MDPSAINTLAEVLYQKLVEVQQILVDHQLSQPITITYNRISFGNQDPIKRYNDPRTAELVEECNNPLESWNLPLFSYPLELHTPFDQVMYILKTQNRRHRTNVNKLQRHFEIGKLLPEITPAELRNIQRIQGWSQRRQQDQFKLSKRIWKIFSTCGLHYIYQVQIMTPARVEKMTNQDFTQLIQDITRTPLPELPNLQLPSSPPVTPLPPTSPSYFPPSP
jgi:hypothetical protein